MNAALVFALLVATAWIVSRPTLPREAKGCVHEWAWEGTAYRCYICGADETQSAS